MAVHGVEVNAPVVVAEGVHGYEPTIEEYPFAGIDYVFYNDGVVFMKFGEATKATENARQSIAVGEALIANGIQDVDVQKTLADARVQLDKCFSLTAKK